MIDRDGVLLLPEVREATVDEYKQRLEAKPSGSLNEDSTDEDLMLVINDHGVPGPGRKLAEHGFRTVYLSGGIPPRLARSHFQCR
jgi:hypothetical protein